MDLHAAQIQGFFRIPVDQILAAPVLFEYLNNKLFTELNKKDFVLMMGDAGAAKQFAYYEDELKLPVAIVNKVRIDHTEKPVIKNIIGEMGPEKKVLIVDDEIASGGTIIETVKFIQKNYNVSDIYVAAVHPVLTGDAVKKLYDSPVRKIIITDTLPVESKIKPFEDKFTVISVAPLFARAIKCIHEGDQMTDLFPESVKRKAQ
jgi:ribose-phosphate pyrophosphokinase